MGPMTINNCPELYPAPMGRPVVVVVIVDCYEFQPDQVVHFYSAPAVCYTGKTAGEPS